MTTGNLRIYQGPQDDADRYRVYMDLIPGQRLSISAAGDSAWEIAPLGAEQDDASWGSPVSDWGQLGDDSDLISEGLASKHVQVRLDY